MLLDPIVVTDYDQRWPAQFEELAAPVRAAVADLQADIEHVGSTAVPGLPAKPIIDIDVVLQSETDVPVAIERLRSIGYTHEGDLGIPGREAFTWPAGTPRHHLYTVIAGNQAHRDHIDFRDYLRAHPETARDYARLKRALATEQRDDRDGYATAKSAFITEVVHAASHEDSTR